MFTPSWLRSSVVLGCALALGACGSAATSPSPATTALVTAGLGAGTFASTKAMTSQANACGNFTWTITQATSTSVSGTFAATCNGTTPVSGAGSATATLSGTSIVWNGNASASVPGNSNCALTLSGTVELSGTDLRIAYAGSTCFGPVSGAEVIAKK
jgi:hypothetical protein